MLTWPAMTRPAGSMSLAVASALAFGWGTVMVLVSFAVMIPRFPRRGRRLHGGPRGALESRAGSPGTGSGARKWPYVALGASTAWIAFLVLVPLKISLPGIALNIVILGLVLTNLPRFR